MLFKNRLAVSLTFLTCGFIYANWSTRLPRIQEQFSLSNATLGFVLLFVALGSLSSMPLMGILIGKKGSKWATILSFIPFCLISIGIPYLTNIWQLTFVFYLLGMFMGALDVAMNAQAVVVEQTHARPMMSSFHAFFSVGMMIGALTGAFFARFFETLEGHFWTSSLIGIGTLSIIFPFLINDSPQKQESDSPLFVLPNRMMLTLGFIAFIAMIAEGSMADWTSNYAKNILKTDESTAAFGLSVFSFTMTIGRFFGDKVRIHFGDKQLLFISSVLATFGLIIALILLNHWIFFGGIFIVGLGLSIIVPIIYSQAGNDTKLPQGMALSMVTTLGYLGFLVGPPSIGILAEWYNLRIGLAFVAILLLILSILTKKARI